MNSASLKTHFRSAVFALLCLVIGVGLAIQIQMPKGQKLYVSPKTVDEYNVQIDSENRTLAQTQELIAETEGKLAEYEAMLHNEEADYLLEAVGTEVERYKLLSGSVPVEGSGVVITIEDEDRDLYLWENPNDLIVHDLDILMILNDLYTAGAEAVAVNGHRLINSSSVTCAGYTVRVNGQFEAVPYVIEAIGDPGRLYQAMVATGTSGDILKDYVKFKVVVKEDIELPAYMEDRTYQYMKVTKEGETN